MILGFPSAFVDFLMISPFWVLPELMNSIYRLCASGSSSCRSDQPSHPTYCYIYMLRNSYISAHYQHTIYKFAKAKTKIPCMISYKCVLYRILWLRSCSLPIVDFALIFSKMSFARKKNKKGEKQRNKVQEEHNFEDVGLCCKYREERNWIGNSTLILANWGLGRHWQQFFLLPTASS